MDFYGSAKVRRRLSCSPFYTEKGGSREDICASKTPSLECRTERSEACAADRTPELHPERRGPMVRRHVKRSLKIYHGRVNGGGGPRWPWDLGAARDVHNGITEGSFTEVDHGLRHISLFTVFFIFLLYSPPSTPLQWSLLCLCGSATGTGWVLNDGCPFVASEKKSAE